MNMGKLAALAILSALWLQSGGKIRGSSAEDERPKTVVLTGVVKLKTEWGPPGFGQTPKIDSKVVIYILRLAESRTAKQLSLEPVSKGEEERVSEIQLWCESTVFPKCESRLKGSIGHRITVAGQVGRPIEALDYLPVILHVRLISD
jgi:hypothetical protein